MIIKGFSELDPPRRTTVAASIFLKDCPECAAANPVDALRCACGYRFDSKGADTTVDGLELIAQEERIYRDYLAARLEQAAKELEHARAVAKASPGDKVKAAELLLAEQRYNAARAELEAQQLRAQAVAARAKSARRAAMSKPKRENPGTPPPRGSEAAVTAAAANTVTTPRPAEAKAAPTTDEKREPPVARPKPTTDESAKRPAAETGRRTEGPAATPAPGRKPAGARPEDATAAPQTRTAAVQPPPAPVAENRRPAAAVSKPAAAPTTKRPATAAAAFSTTAAAAARSAVGGVAGSPVPSAAFRAQQSARAQAILQAQLKNATKECPNCTASVPLKATKCRCGFEFADGQCQIPPLTLSAEERNALLQALSGWGPSS